MAGVSLSAMVRAGQKISATAWNAIVQLVLGARLFKGVGILLDSTPDGTTISLDARAFAWLHAFKCRLLADGTGVTIRRGLVNGQPVSSAGKELSPDETNTFHFPQAARFDAHSRGWVAVEVTFDGKWSVLSAKLVQVADLDSETGDVPKKPLNGYQGGGTLTLSALPGGIGKRARWPIAELIRRDSGQLALCQVTHFDLMHRANIPAQADGKPGTAGRHFFFFAA